MERETAQLVEITADDANRGEAGDGEDDVKEANRKVQEELRDAQNQHEEC